MSDLLLTREHRIYTARKSALSNNLKALRGGRPYVEARLQRAPNESLLSWEGKTPIGSESGLSGRKDRAFLVNDASRIAAKINQYLFADEATRNGIDPAFEDDCTGIGTSVRSFWGDVSELYTIHGYCWVQADRGAPERDPQTGRPLPRSVARREQLGDRSRWSIWTSLDVVDWCFDPAGELVWLLLTEDRYANQDPLVEAETVTERTLWRRGDGRGATWARYRMEKSKAEQVASGDVSSRRIPFMVVGNPSADPWWFDEVEMLQAAQLNLGSLHYENLIKTVYPQLVVPSSMLANLQLTLQQRFKSAGSAVAEYVRELIRGLDRPFVEAAEDQGITRYLQPSASDLKALPDELDRLRRLLFDSKGLALFNRETRQVQSAESKQFDHLDTEATLRNRALVLQDAEKRLIALTRELDAEFREYDPVWPQSFDVPNTAEDMAALMQIANLVELPPTMQKQMLRAVLRIMDGIERISVKDRNAILTEIDDLPDNEPPTPPPIPT